MFSGHLTKTDMITAHERDYSMVNSSSTLQWDLNFHCNIYGLALQYWPLLAYVRIIGLFKGVIYLWISIMYTYSHLLNFKKQPIMLK